MNPLNKVPQYFPTEDPKWHQQSKGTSNEAPMTAFQRLERDYPQAAEGIKNLYPGASQQAHEELAKVFWDPDKLRQRMRTRW